MLDTLQILETPEAIDLELHLAGPVARIMAFAIDFAIRAALYILMFIVVNFTGTAGMGLWMIMMFVLEWFYPVLFEMLANGKTPGKSALRIQVINENGTPLTWSGSIIRNLLRAVDFLPFGYAFGLTAMTMNKRFQRLGDLAAGTVVIYQQQQSSATRIADAKPEPTPIALTSDEQKALLNFSERYRQLTPARQRELANHLAPVLGAQDQAAIDRINGISRWLMGAR